MRTHAWQVVRIGEPGEALEWREVDLPELGPEDVLIDVEAAAVNFVDLLLCRGGYQERPELPFTPGCESVGRVVAAGAGSPVAVGRRVIANPWMPGGGLAEMMVAPGELTYELDDDIDAVKGAALHTAYATAVVCLDRRGRLQAGETLLVHAGSGSVGSAAIQVGRAMGARVLATASSEEKRRVCLDLGAEQAFDSGTDFIAAVREATGGKGADVVWDSVGGDVFERSRRCVAFEGRILIIGFTSGVIPRCPTNHPMLKGYSIVGAAAGLYRNRDPAYWRAAHDRVMDLYRRELIDPLIGSEMTLADAPAALERLAHRRTIGKTVLRTA